MKPGALLILLFLIGNTEPKNNPEIRFEGLKIWVTDLKKAETFYSSILGFEMQSVTAASAQLNTKSFPIHLALASQKNMTDYESHERTGLTIQVNKLLPAIDLLRQKRGRSTRRSTSTQWCRNFYSFQRSLWKYVKLNGGTDTPGTSI